MPKFDYAVKYHGKYYPAGADIPEAVPVEEAPFKYEGPETSTEEAALKAAVAAETAETAKDEATTDADTEAPKKAAKGRKKGDA